MLSEEENLSDSDSTLAVLIDADNTSHDSIKQILDRSTKFGRTIIKRAYGDWTTLEHQNWGNIFREYAIKPVQQFRYTTGKNSTDSTMIIDAMDILHEKRVETFILVTSDSDFTGLATRIREAGLKVIGIGRKTTPASFRKGCDDFIFLETLDGKQEHKKKPERQMMTSTLNSSTSLIDKQDGKDLLARAVKQAADENGCVTGARLGMILKRLDPAFTPQNYGAKKLADFIAQHQDVIKPTDKRSGVDRVYKVEEKFL